MLATRGDRSRRAAVAWASGSIASRLGTLQIRPALRRACIARSTQAAVVKRSFGVSRMTTMWWMLRGSDRHARVKPAIWAWYGFWPCGMTHFAPVSWTTKIVLIRGCAANHFGSVWFHWMHLLS